MLRPERESRPVASGPAESISTAIKATSPILSPEPDTLLEHARDGLPVQAPEDARRAWAYALTSRCASPPPIYGSPAWVALPDGPEKVGSAVIAAEATAIGDEMRLDELRAQWWAVKNAEDITFHEIASSHRRDWTGRGFRADPRQAEEIAQEWDEWAGGEAG